MSRGDAETITTGNAWRREGVRNPLAARLVAHFDTAVDELFSVAAPASVLDVGCGEGILAKAWAERPEMGRVVGIDLPDPRLAAEWRSRRHSVLEYRFGDACNLPFGAGEFDMAAGVEVLEHVPDPKTALAEMVRVARRHLLVSVPREPLWRGLNLLRGRYWRRGGSTPGHVNAWSRRAFLELVSRYGRLEAVRGPLPWTVVLLRVEDPAGTGR